MMRFVLNDWTKDSTLTAFACPQRPRAVGLIIQSTILP
jgi:hypothetical protein